MLDFIVLKGLLKINQQQENAQQVIIVRQDLMQRLFALQVHIKIKLSKALELHAPPVTTELQDQPLLELLAQQDITVQKELSHQLKNHAQQELIILIQELKYQQIVKHANQDLIVLQLDYQLQPVYVMLDTIARLDQPLPLLQHLLTKT